MSRKSFTESVPPVYLGIPGVLWLEGVYRFILTEGGAHNQILMMGVTGLQMIAGSQMMPDRKWSPTSTANDLDKN